MIVSRIQLFCQGMKTGCEDFFPKEGPVDGAIYTHGALRKMAKKNGWSRIDDMDVCPNCDAIITRQANALLNKYKAAEKGGRK